MEQESRGVILFNRGQKCIIRAMLALYTLRKHWDGPVTFFLEDPYPHEFDEVCKYFNVDVVHNEMAKDTGALVRKTETLLSSPYDRTVWLDADTIVVGKIDEMFNYLDTHNVAIPHFAGWWSDGKAISKRINNFKNSVSPDILQKALQHNPAINTGVVAYRKNSPFMQEWIKLALKTDGLCFISDEVAFQVLYPSYMNEVFIAPIKFNVSVKHDPNTEDKRIIHFHGQKHVLDVPLASLWKQTFKEMVESNIANINHFVKEYADKRLSMYLKRGDNYSDVTIVTACDEKYVEFLRLTFPNWVKYKKIDKLPVIVFVHGIPLEDSRLDFLRLPNVKMIPWSMPEITDHREEMLSAFVFGAAENVGTDYWMKLDADSYATDYRPLFDDSMKKYAFCGHKWKYSRPEHINGLDAWAKGHWKGKLKKAKPMITEGKVEGRRFFHNTMRTISFVQLHKTKFTQFCVKLLRTRRLPVPTQDTFLFYVCNRFDPKMVGIKNFKRDYGFAQGNSRLGVEDLKNRLDAVEANKPIQDPTDDYGNDDPVAEEKDVYDVYDAEQNGEDQEETIQEKLKERAVSVSFTDEIVYVIREVK